MIGETVSHYKIFEKLGEGGMGVVYKAEDTKLRRTVALKFLPQRALGTEEEKARFVHEAQAAAALSHANICTVHEIDEHEDQSFIVMEYIEGESLKEKMQSGPLELGMAIAIAVQTADGLREAHEKGIVHRDIKPANIMITPRGQVKIMDFGLAKLHGQTGLTREGTTLGTVSYMSPEQATGADVDHRSDIWSLGVVLYEMVTGQRPFKGDYDQAVIYSIINVDPKAPSSIRKDIPAPLEGIILRALEKDPSKRFQSVREFREALKESGSDFHAGYRDKAPRPAENTLKRPAVMIPILVAAIISIFYLVRYMQHTNRVSWATQEVLPAVLELVEGENYYKAYELALQIKDVIPSDPLLEKAWDEMTCRMTVITEPPGARVSVKEYKDPGGEWLPVGQATLDCVELPKAFLRWKIQMEGFTQVELARWSYESDTLRVTLDEFGAIPEGMVRVRGGSRGVWIAGEGWFETEELPDFFLDRYEVTNHRFQAFVNEGGYRRREFWKHDFVREGRILAWEQAMELFRDKTGRTGPATWELGSFPDGQQQFPVTGVSWYEAAAYAEFAGKALPSIHHWVYAAALRQSNYVIPFSNFGRAGLDPAGSNNGLGYYGDYDMAGNAREWCFNATGSDRYIFGGCWNEPLYMFNFPLKLQPFDRSPCNGFRCIQQIEILDDTHAVWREIPTSPVRDFSKEEPAGDEAFKAYLTLYEYEKTPLNAEIEFTDDEPEHWTIQRISFDTAYERERMFAYLFIPRGVSQPYQTVVFFPGAFALSLRSSKKGRELNSFGFVEFVIRSGRAALCPVYKSTYERGDGYDLYDPGITRSEHMNHILMWWKDLSRSIDYLETRQDIDMSRLAYMGSSWGGWLAPLFLAQDKRYRTAVLRLCGLPTWETPPAFDPFNFIPRITLPVLMLNGRYDYIFPHETSQVPLFEGLGTPPEHKRHVIFDTAHGIYGHRNEMIREVLDWLDTYLGPVEKNYTGEQEK